MKSDCTDKITSIIEACRKGNPCELEIRYDEPMSGHTSFKVGGTADCWLRPLSPPDGESESFPAFAASLIDAARAEHLPLFFLGGGANILVADAGIRGIVLDTGGWHSPAPKDSTACRQEDGNLCLRAGTKLDAAAEIAAEMGLCGLEFLAGMPGSIGGAVWMNARCYGQEIADVLGETGIIDFTGPKTEILRLPANKSEFGYKFSPFQNRSCLILSASFHVTPGETDKIRAVMDTHRKDREAKGHYHYPSAGSVFKNNMNFGKPSGKIIDELGLCGLCKGGARIAPWHGNIIINTGGATAMDIRALVDEAAARVKAATGFILEPEILFVGEWNT